MSSISIFPFKKCGLEIDNHRGTGFDDSSKVLPEVSRKGELYTEDQPMDG